MNIVIISGYITKDIELKTSSGGMAWTSFSIATDNPGRDKGTSFITCKAFGNTATLISKHGGKGKKATVQGHIQTGSYVGKDGKKNYTTDVIVDRIEFAEWTKLEADETDKEVAGNIPDGFEQILEDVPF